MKVYHVLIHKLQFVKNWCNRKICLPLLLSSRSLQMSSSSSSSCISSRARWVCHVDNRFIYIYIYIKCFFASLTYHEKQPTIHHLHKPTTNQHPITTITTTSLHNTIPCHNLNLISTNLSPHHHHSLPLPTLAMILTTSIAFAIPITRASSFAKIKAQTTALARP